MLSPSQHEMPWPLDMANVCMNGWGNVLHFPRRGTWADQDDDEMSLMQLAWYVRKLYQKDKKEALPKWSPNDAKFIFWLEREDVELFDYELMVKADG